jgi:very-short-patch-repair endonuclease
MRGPQPWRSNRSKVLRSRENAAEAQLWAKLRNRRLGGFKFVRQAAVGVYFVDFLCRDRMLVVEVDGATHGEESEIAKDAFRSRDLERQGYRIVRVTNWDVANNIDGVLDSLLAALRGEL